MAASDSLSPEQHGHLLAAIRRASQRWELPEEAFSMKGVSGNEVTMVSPGKFWGPRVGRIEHTFDVSTPDAPQVGIEEFTTEGQLSSSTNPSARENVVGLYDYRKEGKWRTDRLPWNPGLAEEGE